MDSYQKIIKLGIGPGDKGIFKQPNIRFYYERILPDKDGNPTCGVASVCVIRIPNPKAVAAQAAEKEHRIPDDLDLLPMDADLPPIYVRGLSFCVPQDQFNKKEGRTAALGRAIQAVEKKTFSNPIVRRAKALLENWPATASFTFYSDYNATLTPREKALFNVSMENNG